MKKEAATSKTLRTTKTPKAPALKTARAATKAASPKTPLTTAPQLSDAEVARRAYEIFLGRNGMPGDPLADWLQAEQELKSASQ